MIYTLCPICMGQGFCPKKSVALFRDDQLSDPRFVRDLKAFVSDLGISDCVWHEYLTDTYRNYTGWVVGHDGREIFLNMEEFERLGIREWFRDFIRPCPEFVTPRVRKEARERVRILATILAMQHPIPAAMWGVRPANDNEPPKRR